MKLPQSLHQMLRDTVAYTKHIQDTFLIEKVEGQWINTSYGSFLEKVNALSAYLVESGFTKGERLGMILENCPEYLMFDQALMQIGCINVSIYPTLPENDIEYILNDSGSRGVLVGNPFLLKKVLKALNGCPGIEKIFINFDPAKAGSDDPRIIALGDLFQQGSELYRRNRDGIEKLFNQIGPQDIASLIYTSGTTGIPKGVILTHENFMSNVWMAKNVIQVIYPSDRYLSFLPLCHVYERLATYYLATYVGCEIAFAQGIETIAANMQEIKPTLMTTVPRLMERVRERIIKNAESQGPTKKKIFHWAMKVGERHRKRKEQKAFISPLLGLKYFIADKLVFGKIRARLGGRMRMLVSGGAALPQHVGEFFGNVGVRALEGYGLTETSPLISVNEFDRQVFGTVGRIVPGLQIGIYENETGAFHTIQTYDSFDPRFECAEGEIVVKGPSVMKGYWNKPEDTAAVIDKDGWFHTGDVGKFYQGNLKITDRIKNMIVNAYGKNVYPTPVENAYLQSMRIDQIFLIGDKREFITAIVVPSKEEIKEKFGVKESFFEEENLFIENEDIVKWIAEDVRKYSHQLAKFERVKNFIIKRTPFSIDLGEMTPTLKTRRKVIEQRYRQEIDAMYEGVTEDLT